MTRQVLADMSVAGKLSGGNNPFLCSPTSYAPGTQTVLSTTSATFAAVSSGTVSTGSFTAPASGKVIVEVSFVESPSASAIFAAYGLCAVGTITPLVCPMIETKTTSDFLFTHLKFLVTGLTPGTSYNFDLMFAVGGTTPTLAIYAYGKTGTTITGSNANAGSPIIMTVMAA